MGINYFGSSNELHGCVADVQRMCSLLDLMGFPQDQAQRRVLVDTPQWPGHLRPTLKNMRRGSRVQGRYCGFLLLAAMASNLLAMASNLYSSF